MQEDSNDHRHHLRSFLMQESLVDKAVMASTERDVVRMLPAAHVLKIGGSSVLDAGSEVVLPVVEALASLLDAGEKLVIGTGGGARSRHVFSIGLDLGLTTGVLAQLAAADALGNAHILGTLLAPYGVVAIPPEIFGHLLPFFLKSAPGVIFSGEPPYSLWEHPPPVGRIPPHRTDAGSYLVAECFGARTCTLVKDVDGLYDRDPKRDTGARFISEISVAELKHRKLETLPFDRVLLDLLERARLMKVIRIVNGRKPDTLLAALRGEHVGSVIYA